MKKVKKGSNIFIIFMSLIVVILLCNMMYRSAIHKAEVTGVKSAYIDMAHDMDEE